MIICRYAGGVARNNNNNNNNNKQNTTNNKQRTTNTNNKQQLANNKQHATNNEQRATHNKLEHQIQVEFLLGDPLDVARLPSMEDFPPFHDLRPLVAFWVVGVEDDSNGASGFGCNFLHCVNS